MSDSFIQLYLSLGRGDRTPEVEAALAGVLRAHPEYAAAIRRESAFDTALAAAMTDVPLPAGLHDRLLKAAFARRGTALRRAASRTFALAAMVMMALGIGAGTYWRTRPVLDGDAIAIRGELEREATQETVQNWLVKHNLPGTLPLDFDYRWHSFHGKGELGDAYVPVVVFQRGQDFAHVFIVKDFAADTGRLKDAEASLCRVTVTRANGVTYVILHSTDRLDPFLRQILGQQM